jgi:spiro-SPASM protein
MENYVVLNAIHIDNYAFEPLFPDGDSALARTVRRASLLTEHGPVFMLVSDAEGGDRIRSHLDAAGSGIIMTGEDILSTGDYLAALEFCATEAAARGAGKGSIFYHIYADAPLFDDALAVRIAEKHCTYYATYSFADGYPRFLAPEIVSVSILGQLRELYRSQKEAGRDIGLTDTVLFDIIQKDINAYDIETEIAPQDLRMLRVDLAARGKRNSMLVRKLVEAGGTDEDSIMKLLTGSPELLRSVPAYIYVQIFSGCPQHCRWCPYPDLPGSGIDRSDAMEPSLLASILDQTLDLCESATVGLSLWGEPAYHPRVEEMIGAVLKRPPLTALIETSGIGWTLPVLDAIRETEGSGDRLEWIVSLDALSSERYRAVRGEGMDEAVAAVHALLERFPGHVRVQAVRTRENEAELEQFYRFWNKQGVEVIIQKYDSFAGRLPDRKVTDLSPVNRFPCWHLKRDLHVFLDGTVPLCREILPGTGSIEEGTILGNLRGDSLEEVWQRGARRYLEHTRQQWGEPCGRCDEYYTFNF